MNTKKQSARKALRRKMADEFYKREMEIGRLYPHEFLDSLALSCHSVLMNWLRNQKPELPEELIDLVDLSNYMRLLADNAEHGSLHEHDLHDLSSEVACCVNFIMLFGGSFYDSDGNYSYPRESVITWQVLQTDNCS